MDICTYGHPIYVVCTLHPPSSEKIWIIPGASCLLIVSTTTGKSTYLGLSECARYQHTSLLGLYITLPCGVLIGSFCTFACVLLLPCFVKCSFVLCLGSCLYCLLVSHSLSLLVLTGMFLLTLSILSLSALNYCPNHWQPWYMNLLSHQYWPLVCLSTSTLEWSSSLSTLKGDLFITGIIPPIGQVNNSAAGLCSPCPSGVDLICNKDRYVSA